MTETTKKFNTRIGDLFFDHDYPTNPSVQHLYDTMDFQRACQLYLWALPIVGVARWRQAYRETFDLGDNEVVMVRAANDLFPPVIAGMILAAVLSAFLSARMTSLLSSGSFFSRGLFSFLLEAFSQTESLSFF